MSEGVFRLAPGLRSLRRRTVVIVVMAGLLLILPVTTYAIVRPGCSLLPVSLPSSSYSEAPADPAQVCQALGHPLAEPQYLPLGLHRSGIVLFVADPAIASQAAANVSYAIDSRNVMALALRVGAFPTGNQPNTTVDGLPAQVEQRTLADGSPEGSYLWYRGGLMLSLHINQVSGLTTEGADHITASIR